MITDHKTSKSSVYIIAEAGVNHNGSIDLAKQLVDIAAEVGADAVKFQTFKANSLVSRNAPKAEYQKITTCGEESQHDMIKKLELDESAHRILIRHCQERKIHFLSTPFDSDSVDLLTHVFDLPRIKLSSGEITNGPLLLKVAQTSKPIILSTGMSTLEEIEDALGVMAFGYIQSGEKPSREVFHAAYGSGEGRQALQENVVLLHCTTEYPVPFHEVNLRAMVTLMSTFGLPVGLSDHSQGITVSIAAVAMGACVIEKHFTIDRELPGPDHRASLDPVELKSLITAIRQVEVVLGDGKKIPTSSELKNRGIVRKSLVAKNEIRQGDIFSEQNMTAKRPGTGISPMDYWKWLGTVAEKAYTPDELIQRSSTKFNE